MARPAASRLDVVTEAGDVTDLAAGSHGLPVQLDAQFRVTSETVLQSPGQVFLRPAEDIGHDDNGGCQGR